MTHCHDADPPQKLLAVSFAVMSLCQLIPFLFNILGQRVSEDSMDVMGLSIFTLGNIGGCPPKVCVCTTAVALHGLWYLTGEVCLGSERELHD